MKTKKQIKKTINRCDWTGKTATIKCIEGKRVKKLGISYDGKIYFWFKIVVEKFSMQKGFDPEIYFNVYWKDEDHVDENIIVQGYLSKYQDKEIWNAYNYSLTRIDEDLFTAVAQVLFNSI
jgi:hypothetical protein